MGKDLIRIHERIPRRHPELSATDVLKAWGRSSPSASATTCPVPRSSPLGITDEEGFWS